MREFELIDLANLYFSGYRYLIVHHRHDHVMLRPSKDKGEETLMEEMGFHQVHIFADEIKELAYGVGWLPAYLPENFFEEADAVHMLSLQQNQ